MDTNSNFQGSVPGAPPPPPEVKIRTMRSDLESMARSGGGAPQFQNVAIVGLAAQGGEAADQQAPAGTAASQAEAPSTPSKSHLGPVLVIIVALIALAVVGYFAYTVFYH